MKGSQGFTFIELLIASTMISILIVGLSPHLRGAGVVWQRAVDTVNALQQERVAMERLERDLANAFVYDPDADPAGPLAAQFGAETLRISTVSPTTPQRPGSVRFVSYECAERDGTLSLWRTSQSVGEARARIEPLPALLLPDCQALSFRYAYQSPPDAPDPIEWHAEWQGDQTELPRLVEVTVTLQSGRAVRRLMVIPAGHLKELPPPPGSIP